MNVDALFNKFAAIIYAIIISAIMGYVGIQVMSNTCSTMIGLAQNPQTRDQVAWYCYVFFPKWFELIN